MPETKSVVTYKDGPYRSLEVDDLELKRGGEPVELTADQLDRVKHLKKRGVQLDVADTAPPAGGAKTTTTKTKEGTSS